MTGGYLLTSSDVPLSVVSNVLDEKEDLESFGIPAIENPTPAGLSIYATLAFKFQGYALG